MTDARYAILFVDEGSIDYTTIMTHVDFQTAKNALADELQTVYDENVYDSSSFPIETLLEMQQTLSEKQEPGFLFSLGNLDYYIMEVRSWLA